MQLNVNSPARIERILALETSIDGAIMANLAQDERLISLTTPLGYKAAAAWGGNRFGNAKLHSLGWSQLVATPDAMAQTFEAMRRQQAKQ